MLFPVWFVFRFLLQDKSFKVIESVSTHPLDVNSLVISDGRSIKMLIANFTSSDQKVLLNIPVQKLTSKELNEVTFGDAAGDINWLINSPSKSLKPPGVILLKPYSVCFVE